MATPQTGNLRSQPEWGACSASTHSNQTTSPLAGNRRCFAPTRVRYPALQVYREARERPLGRNAPRDPSAPCRGRPRWLQVCARSFNSRVGRRAVGRRLGGPFGTTQERPPGALRSPPVVSRPPARMDSACRFVAPHRSRKLYLHLTANSI